MAKKKDPAVAEPKADAAPKKPAKKPAAKKPKADAAAKTKPAPEAKKTTKKAPVKKVKKAETAPVAAAAAETTTAKPAKKKSASKKKTAAGDDAEVDGLRGRLQALVQEAEGLVASLKHQTAEATAAFATERTAFAQVLAEFQAQAEKAREQPAPVAEEPAIPAPAESRTQVPDRDSLEPVLNGQG